jgi:hypothetical protein
MNARLAVIAKAGFELLVPQHRQSGRGIGGLMDSAEERIARLERRVADLGTAAQSHLPRASA